MHSQQLKMQRINPAKSWDVWRTSAFWDRPKMTVSDFRAHAMARSDVPSRDLLQAIRYMPPPVVSSILGRDNFITHWPEWRKALDQQEPRDKQQVIRYDDWWSDLVFQVRGVTPVSNLDALTRKDKQLLKTLHGAKVGNSIYGLAKLANRPYRRVWDQVWKLTQMGMVKTVKSEQSGTRGYRVFLVKDTNSTALPPPPSKVKK